MLGLLPSLTPPSYRERDRWSPLRRHGAGPIRGARTIRWRAAVMARERRFRGHLRCWAARLSRTRRCARVDRESFCGDLAQAKLIWVNNGQPGTPKQGRSLEVSSERGAQGTHNGGQKGRELMPISRRWPIFNPVRRRQELMDHMMQRLGVDVLTAIRADDGQAFVEARARCRSCLHESDCRNWLESSEGLPLPPDFCPNANLLRTYGLLGSYGLWRERRPAD